MNLNEPLAFSDVSWINPERWYGITWAGGAEQAVTGFGMNDKEHGDII